MLQAQVLFHAKRIHRETLSNIKYQETLQKIISGTHPHIEWLENALYEGQRVGSARIDRAQHGQRLIFTYLRNAQGKRCLFLLGETHHDYNEVARWLKTTGITTVGSMLVNAEMVDERFLDLLDEQPPTETQERPHIAFLDESQQQALNHTATPLMFLGPAGAGKTLVLETFMANHLTSAEVDIHQASSSTASDTSLFVSQSELLLESLRKECDVPEAHFNTWEHMLAAHFKGQSKITHSAFKQWLTKNFPGDDAEQVHFELSLIVAYGESAYLGLEGARQTYYSGNKAKQQQCITILKAWQKHLHANASYDPMTSLPPPAAVKVKTYCDEGQNFPPSALAYLIEQAQDNHFYISFDPEQSLTSPFTYAFVKQRLNSKGYSKIERLLEQTWRNRPEVVEVINCLMAQKHHWEGNHHKRPYQAIRSAQAPGGQVSWVTNASLDKLRNHAQHASTVVIAELPEEPKARERERQEIIKKMGTHQILSASEAIGMTFKTVILWKPVSLNPCVRKLLAQEQINALTLEQWISLNAIQIALGRAQENIFMYEPEEHFRTKGELCFGNNLPIDGALKVAPVDDKKAQDDAWKKKIEEHLAEGNKDLAIDLMRNQLHLTEEQIIHKLGPAAEPSSLPQESRPKANKNQTKPKKSAPVPVAKPSQPKVTTKTPSAAKKGATPSAAATAITVPVVSAPSIDTLSQLEIIAVVKELNAAFAKGTTNDAKANLKTNLKKLLSHPQAIRYLFYSPSLANTCLAMKFMGDAEYQPMILSYLGSNCSLNNLIEYQDPAVCAEILNFISQSEEGIRFFKESLNQTVLVDNVYASFLYSLTASDIGIDLLYEWLQAYPPLIKGISGRMLCVARPENGVIYANASPLYWLCSSEIGQKILYLLLRENPQLATEISSKALCLPRTGANTPPLYWLSCTTEGCVILDILQSKNKELAKTITEANLSLKANIRAPEHKPLNEFITSHTAFHSTGQSDVSPTNLFQDADIEELHVPKPWTYVAAPQQQQQIKPFTSTPEQTSPKQGSLIIKSNQTVHYFCATTSTLPITPLPPSFLQASGFITVTKSPPHPNQPPKVTLYFKYPEGTTRAKPPISLRTILNDKQYKPTMTQLVDLMTKITAEMDWLPPTVVFYPSLDTIFITSPEKIGSDKPLAFQLCPSALLLTEELAPDLKRDKIHRRMTAKLFLHIATQTPNLHEPLLTEKITEAQKRYPAFIAAFTELWKSTDTQEITQEGPTLSLQQLSPTVGAFHKIRLDKLQTWNATEFSTLLSGVACNHSRTISSVSADALLNLYKNSSAKEKLEMTKHLAQSVELLIPSEQSKLTDPDSKSKSMHWINRMNLISALLQELEHQGDYEALHETQQRLLEGGIGKHLGSNLADHNGKFALSVLVPVVKVSVWMAFQFATLKTRFIFDRNVKRMAQMLFDVVTKEEGQRDEVPSMSAHESQQYILMMLIMSDFGSWLKQDALTSEDIEAKLLTLWNTIDLQLLLDFGLPCYRESLSDETTKLIEKKLEQHINRLIQKSAQISLSDSEQQQLRTSLSYLKSFAWRAHEQVTNASFQSLYISYFLAIIFTKPQQTVFYESKPLLPIKPRVHSMQQLVDAAQTSISQPQAVSKRQQRKLALSPHHLIGFDSSHQHKVSSHFLPNASTAGAPVDITQFIFSLPENKQVQYRHDIEKNIIDKTILQTIKSDELKKLNKAFIPTTLTTAQRICTVQNKNTGTQGMIEVHIADAGDFNSVLIGLTSNKTLDGEKSIPGTTATSISLDIATGNIRFFDAKNDMHMEYPYTKPAHSGSKVSFGITGTKVYCIVDGTFYPPIRGFELPEGADIHPLIRIGCPGVKLIPRVMGSLWNLDRHPDRSFKNAPSNPVAYNLYLAELRTKVCPHYHIHKHATGIDGFTELLSSPQLIAKQEPGILLDLLMTLLARHECLAQNCAVPEILQKLISDLSTQPVALDAKESHVTTSPERLLELTEVLGLTELASAIKQRFREKPSVAPLSLFAPERKPTHSGDEINNAQISIKQTHR
ncbi:hypothetical protein [Legionella rowbothamii]|uniref:hypothetical protein n=1 Tax=Legionella rowbothamii TaxID=96229 RepID=UPI0010559C53|nr:hypothetical protein [Legionella rowbothamii]